MIKNRIFILGLFFMSFYSALRREAKKGLKRTEIPTEWEISDFRFDFRWWHILGENFYRRLS